MAPYLAASLLGPPEIHHIPLPSPEPSPPPPPPPPPAAAAPSNPFMELLTTFNSIPTALTENLSPTFPSSGDPSLDFFFHVVPDTPPSTTTSLLDAAWHHNPLTALKLLCHLRAVRGTGKSDREGFYASALWLHQHHPKTLALNLSSIADLGYIKDLPEILHRLLLGRDVRKKAKEARVANHKFFKVGRFWRRVGKNRNDKTRSIKEGTREERLAKELARVKIEMENASQSRKRKRAEMAIRALQRYNRDPDYRFLHDRVADYFAGKLHADIEHLRSGNVSKIGLAAKWCPSLDSSFDLSTLLCESIARRVFPQGSEEYAGIDERHYVYRVRDRLRKEVLVPLRKALELPEVYMSANCWDRLPYNRVASVAMKNYKKIFEKHDRDRFAEYLSNVEQGKAKISAGALLPHQIIAAVQSTAEEDKVAELQWQRMVKDLSEKGKLENCIAVCDVSGSMYGTPMQVAVALGILTSELSAEPWKGNVITFSSTPELQRITGNSLREKVEFVERMDWGGNTDFQAVFERILEVAVEGKLAPEQMIKRVFVFSDMEFDQASAKPWETDYMAIERKFGERGYGSAVPEIVFWNLRDSRSTPVPSGQKGVALVSGFSKNLMTVFLENGGCLDPVDAMEKAIAGKEYMDLAVFD